MILNYHKSKIMAPKKPPSGRNAPNHPPGRHLFCGEDHHRTDPTYVWSSVDFISTTPPTYHMMHFQSEVDMLNFSSECSEIRRVIAAINMQFEKRNSVEAIKFQKYRNTWLPLIVTFIDRWGLARVPSDIAWAVNDVQSAIDVETISFPPCRPYFPH